MKSSFEKRKVTQLFTIGLILAILYIVIIYLLFMLSAFLGAVTLFILMRKYQFFLTKKYQWKNWAASLALIFISIIILLIPSYFIILFIANKVGPLISNPDPIINNANTINEYLVKQFNFQLLSSENLKSIQSIITNIIPQLIGSGLQILTNIILLYFILWFMLTNRLKMERWLKNASPFKRYNTQLLFNEVKNSVTNNSIGIIVLGFIQGIVAIIGYSIFGISEPILWGLITGAASVIPFAGTMIVWIPMSILLFAQGDINAGIGLSLWGFILIGGIDNVLRFLLQKRMAQTHPIITVFGVIIGLSLLGFWGLIYGPLLLSLFIILTKIYKEEFIS